MVEGDKIQCLACKHEHTVSQEWLGSISAQRGDEKAILARLKCTKCGKKCVNLQSCAGFQQREQVSLHDSGLCFACGGDGGLHGRCWKCDGTGLR